MISPAPSDSKSPVKSLQTQSQQTMERESPQEDIMQQNTAKYASSPKPNNSFSFARGPPDGAEKVPLNVDEIERYIYFFQSLRFVLFSRSLRLYN